MGKEREIYIYIFWDEGNKERKTEESIVVNIVNLSWLIIFSRQEKEKK